MKATLNTGAFFSNYGPFGELIRATGPMAKVNPFRFSTKYDDDESDFLYYGYRYYNPSTGRWPSRDPLYERKGGKNVYAFIANSPIGSIDKLGKLTIANAGGGATSCGGWIALWYYRTDMPRGGDYWLVQEIIYSSLAYNCDGTQVVDGSHFWEALEVNGGQYLQRQVSVLTICTFSLTAAVGEAKLARCHANYAWNMPGPFITRSIAATAARTFFATRRTARAFSPLWATPAKKPAGRRNSAGIGRCR